MTQVPIQPQHQPDYMGRGFAIGKGMSTLARVGTVVMDGGTFIMYNDKGQIIDSAPISSVMLQKSKMFMGTGFYMHVNGTKYSVSGGQSSVASGVAGIAAGALGGDIGALVSGNKGAKAFLQTFLALGGREQN